jgi:SET domain-containing protein
MAPEKILVVKTKKYGLAVIANRDINKGEVVVKINGTIYTPSKLEKLSEKKYRDVRNHAIQFHPDKWRDSKIARLLNHSCQPNCGIKNLFELVSMRKIKKGEELTWDYDMAENDNWRMKCKCGSKNCRGVIRGYRFLPRVFRQKYKGYISTWLLSAKAK